LEQSALTPKPAPVPFLKTASKPAPVSAPKAYTTSKANTDPEASACTFFKGSTEVSISFEASTWPAPKPAQARSLYLYLFQSQR